MIGKTLGHYKIGDQPLGRGGMGEVYRAKDLKLGRDVAIKVLPEEFARDANRVVRFQREAKLLASVNHPNIAAIYGLEESGGIQFLVLELVEGQTLAEQLKRGPIPVEESLKLALQIAEALEAAHEKGVIHRDLKPANIKITPEGKVKVLDFGLAKAFAGDQADLNLSNSPTLSNAATQQGVILGTAAYMSPEQARGKPVDKRADIWAFGCVLYEMLTGRQTWSGTTVTDIIAAALAKDPDFSILPPNIHPDIRKLLNRCLQKDPTERFRDVGDVRVEIKEILADPSGVLVHPVTTVEPRRKLPTILPWVAAAIVLTAIIAGVAVWNLRKPEPRQVTRLYYELPKDQQFGDLTECALAVSPDGRQFVYSTSGGLYLRSMDELDAKLIPGTGAKPQRPFFSPDSKWVGFWSGADNQLKKISIIGGAPVTLTDATSAGFISWGANDTIVYGQQFRGIFRISSNGGTPEEIVNAEGKEFVCPQILPDEKSVLFTDITTLPYKIIVQSLRSGQRKELFAGDTAQYLPTGHILYASGNNLFAIPFNLDRLEVAGGPIPIVKGILRESGAPQYAVSDSGTLICMPETLSASQISQRILVWVNQNGKEDPLTATPTVYSNPKVSPDGTRVALTIGSGENRDIWIWDLIRETMTRLTFNAGQDSCPLWTPDGKRIVFFSNRRNELTGVFWRTADGTGKEEPLSSAAEQRAIYPASWSGDGKTLVLERINYFSQWNIDLEALSMEGDRRRRPLLREKYWQVQPQISPDGKWMAYTSFESGQGEIYLRSFPDVEERRWQVSTSGGNSSLWSRDGRELFYRNGDAIMAVSVKTDPTFSLEKPKILFRGSYIPFRASEDLNPWDIHPDGKRFLMMKEAGSTASSGGGPRKINIVVNWFEELKRRVPAK